MNIFGHQIRVEIAIICVILGIFIGINTTCSCKKEHFVAPSLPSEITDDGPGVGVTGENTGEESWQRKFNKAEMQMIPGKQDNSKIMFDNNECKADCCSYSNYSCSGGCICSTDEQRKLLDNRGGNCSGEHCVI